MGNNILRHRVYSVDGTTVTLDNGVTLECDGATERMVGGVAWAMETKRPSWDADSLCVVWVLKESHEDCEGLELTFERGSMRLTFHCEPKLW